MCTLFLFSLQDNYLYFELNAYAMYRFSTVWYTLHTVYKRSTKRGQSVQDERVHKCSELK